jgi:hypothetical protein
VPFITIMPNFNVHDTTVVDMGLIHINMAYGYMRAADVMSPLEDAAKRDAERLSDAITNLRTETHRLSYLWTDPLRAGAHEMLLEFRFRKWLIRKLVESRIVSGVGIPADATLWFQVWEQGSSSIPNIPNPWGYFVTPARTTPAVDAYSYVPDMCVYEEEGDLTGLYVIRQGAAFRGTTQTIEAVTGNGPVMRLTAPMGTTANLPAVPIPGTVLVEVAPSGMSVQTQGLWIVDGHRRYLLTPAVLAILGGPPITSVPVGGIAPIPDGGTPYWIGGLVIASSAPTMIHRWEPTPQVEGSNTSTAVLLWNRSNGPVNVNDVSITTQRDTATSRMFRVNTSRPFTVVAGQVFTVAVQFDAFVPGPVEGLVTVDCDDSIAPLLRLPLSTSVEPLGSHAELQLSPNPLDLGNALVSGVVGQNVTITNTGLRPGSVAASIISEQPAGQFAVSTYSLINPPPYQRTSVYVSYSPTVRGAARAVLAIDLVSATDVSSVQYQRRYEVPLSGVATAPILFLAAGPRQSPLSSPQLSPLPSVVTGMLDPPTMRPMSLQEMELTTLDFGTGVVNSIVPGSFWVRNTGDAPLTVDGVVVNNQSNFGIVDFTIFPAILQPEDELEVACVFNPGTVPGRPIGGEFWVMSDDPFRPRAILSLFGRAAGPHLAVPPELLDFGPVSPQAYSPLTFTSDGSDPVTINELRLASGEEINGFTVSSTPPVPTTLPPGNSLVVTVTVIATTPGPYQDTLILAHNGTPSQMSQVLLRAAVQP